MTKRQIRGALQQIKPLTVGLILLGLCSFCIVLESKAPRRYQEPFPLSHFPMYSAFDDYDYYVFLADSDGRPIPLEKTSFIRTSRLKKNYNGGINRILNQLAKERPGLRKRELTAAECEPAGKETVQWLYDSVPARVRENLKELAPLRLYHVDLRMKDGAVQESDPKLIAEHQPR